jgi:broad specificity phosphatase PhoE
LAEFSDLVIAGPHSQFVCVSLKRGEGSKLRNLLSRLPSYRTTAGIDAGSGVFSKGDWQGCGDVGQGDPNSYEYIKEVKDGMRLARLQVGEEGAFEKAPLTIEGVMEAIGDDSAALIFVDVENLQSTDYPRPCRLWTSSLKRTKESAEFIRHPVLPHPVNKEKKWLQMDPREYRNLDEIYAGEFEGRTYEFIKEKMGSESAIRNMDKLGYRYPRGESYLDIIARLDEPMQKLESRTEPVLIISHQATARLIYAFLRSIPRHEAPDLEMPLHTVIKLEFDGTSADVIEVQYYLGPGSEIDSSRKGML